MKPRSQCHKSRINGEQSTGCSLRIHFFASRMLLLFLPSCDIYFSFLHTSDLRAAGLRSVVRKTTDLSVILSCLIWKNVGYFLLLLAICDRKFSIIDWLHLYKYARVVFKSRCLRPFNTRFSFLPVHQNSLK